jgi:hypothetical protein
MLRDRTANIGHGDLLEAVKDAPGSAAANPMKLLDIR